MILEVRKAEQDLMNQQYTGETPQAQKERIWDIRPSLPPLVAEILDRCSDIIGWSPEELYKAIVVLLHNEELQPRAEALTLEARQEVTKQSIPPLDKYSLVDLTGLYIRIYDKKVTKEDEASGRKIGRQHYGTQYDTTSGELWPIDYNYLCSV